MAGRDQHVLLPQVGGARRPGAPDSSVTARRRPAGCLYGAWLMPGRCVAGVGSFRGRCRSVSLADADRLSATRQKNAPFSRRCGQNVLIGRNIPGVPGAMRTGCPHCGPNNGLPFRQPAVHFGAAIRIGRYSGSHFPIRPSLLRFGFLARLFCFGSIFGPANSASVDIPARPCRLAGSSCAWPYARQARRMRSTSSRSRRL